MKDTTEEIHATYLSPQGIEEGTSKQAQFNKETKTDTNVTGCFTDSLEG